MIDMSLGRVRRVPLAVLACVCIVLAAAATPATSASTTTGKKKAAPAARAPAKKKARPRPAMPGLVWHVETLEGATIDSRLGDEPVNPASVTKVATTLWALERLGPDYRFETRFSSPGLQPAKDGVLRGDLVVEGAGDPDFQIENALLVARQLNELGYKRVQGALAIGPRFWIGWEDGSDGRDPNPGRRALLMGARLRQALDPARWSGLHRRAWSELAARRGFDPTRPPKVVIVGPTRAAEPAPGTVLVVHRSRPLAETLRRLNAFSNNDIERVGESLGTPQEMSAWVAARLGHEPGSLRFQTTSGLGENRLTPKQMVDLLRALRKTTADLGLAPADVLPVAGCDPGTVTRFFQKIANGPAYAAVVGKTGTLTATDGGVSVFAGFASTAEGELIFAVAQPRAAGRLRAARAREQEFVLELVARHGGPVSRACLGPLGGSADGSDIAPPLLVHPQEAGQPQPAPAADISLDTATGVSQ